MKKIITITFILGLLSSCANNSNNSTDVKEKIKSGFDNFKKSINNPFKKNN
tara:strand:+ start:317 stop:469 length:153 start_codon:yes stop_codon:yes gene_type:complete